MKKFLLTCFALAIAFYSLAQQRTISGKVLSSDDDSALPGVNVLLKGTTVGTVTDADGKYTLNVPPEGGSLVFTFIGLQTQEVPIGDRSVIDVELTLDVTQLSEIVVTALGVERDEKSLGYAVSTIDNQQLTVARSTNVANALTGKIAGVRVQGSNGMVGSSTSIFIRGFTTFTGNNQPLWVVDGIPIDNGGGGNALQSGVSNSNRGIDLNQEDIETMTILKGPAAAVLYGSRAAAGAIIVTMKKGSQQKGKNTVNITSGITFADVNRFPDYQNKYGQGQYGLFNPVNEVNSWGPEIAGQQVTNFRGEQEILTAYPNNVKDLFQTGRNYQNNVSLSGGNDKSNYYLSYGNLHEIGILPSNDLVRNSFSVNTSTKLTNKFTSGLNVIYTNNRSKRTQQGNQRANPFFSTWFLPRSFDWQNYPYVNLDGTQRTPVSATDLTTFNTAFGLDDNPYFTMYNNHYRDQINRIIGNINLSYAIKPWLTAAYKIGTDTYSQEFKTITARSGKTAGGIGSIGDEILNRSEISSYATMILEKRFADDNIGLRALIGNEINQRKTRNNGVTGSDIQIIGLNNITNTLTFSPFGTTTKQRLVGVFADISLDYKNSIFLGLTGRNDWSSTFSPDKRSYFYPAVTASFILTELVPALQDNSMLSFIKLRANYASVGKEAPTYSTDTYYSRSNPGDGFGPNITFPFRGQLGNTLNNGAGNPDLGPEFNDDIGFGTDIRLWNGKINIEVNYYKNTSRDVIFNVPVAAGSGFTTRSLNIGESESKGWEFTLNATPFEASNGFRWDISANWTHSRTLVTKLAPGVTQVTLGGFVTPSTRLIEGQPYSVMFGSVFQREATTGKLLVDAAGRLQTALDNQIIGDPNPKWFAGVTNTFSFKGVVVSALLDIRYGGDIYSRNVSDMQRSGAAKDTEDREVGYIHDAVFADGSPNNIQIHAQDYFTDLYGFGRGEFVVFDGSWVRLREASITYQIPASLLQKTFFGKIEVGLNGRNLWLHAPNTPHIDPEVNAQGQNNSQGLEFNGLPQTRTIGGIIKLSF